MKAPAARKNAKPRASSTDSVLSPKTLRLSLKTDFVSALIRVVFTAGHTALAVDLLEASQAAEQALPVTPRIVAIVTLCPGLDAGDIATGLGRELAPTQRLLSKAVRLRKIRRRPAPVTGWLYFPVVGGGR